MNDKLKDWLEKQGYPLEMRVAKELTNFGFESYQSHYYTDPETEKQREIDVIGNCRSSNGTNIVNFQLIIECKNNQDKPWIAFSGFKSEISSSSYISQRPACRIGVRYLEHISKIQYLETDELFKQPSSLAYNVTQAFESNSDKVYSALMSVVNAIKYRRERVNSETTFSNLCEIYFPIIVIGGKLFDCFLNENNENCVIEVEQKHLLWRSKVLNTPNIVIEITTLESFKRRLPIFKSDFDKVVQLANTFFDTPQSNFNPFDNIT
ncbi:MAG: hypothetical protein ABI921_05510 [Panacibacter sp.]